MYNCRYSECIYIICKFLKQRYNPKVYMGAHMLNVFVFTKLFIRFNQSIFCSHIIPVKIVDLIDDSDSGSDAEGSGIAEFTCC